MNIDTPHDGAQLTTAISPMQMSGKVNSTTRDDTVKFSHEVFELRIGKESSQDSHSKDVKTLTIVLLFTLGVLAGLLNGLTLWANSGLSEFQAMVILTQPKLGWLYFIIITCGLCSFSAFLCKSFSTVAAGSGLPEFKSLLANEIKSSETGKLVSTRILFTKMFGLIFAVGSCLSCGSEGPLVHMSACMAYILMKYIPEFGDIFDSASATKQIFATAAAVGLGSAFNSPVGGLLFSVEVTATFYLISNYWKSFIAAVSGAVACNIFLMTKNGMSGDPVTVLAMDNVAHPFVITELIAFVIIGISLGYLAHFYLRAHQYVFIMLKPFNAKYPIAIAAAVGTFSAFIIYFTGMYTENSVGVIANVSDVLTTATVTSLHMVGPARLGGLLIAAILRAGLTLLGTNIRVPAGIFMPVFLIGGILGRFAGELVNNVFGVDVYLPGYAIVGATAFAAGITHTISVAVIAVELTGKQGMLLPCLIAAIVAAGITKSKGLSVYDQGMVNKGIQSLQLLLMESKGFQYAEEIMDRKTLYFPAMTTIGQFIDALMQSDQTDFAVVENLTSLRLLGTVNRQDVYWLLKERFCATSNESYLTEMLPDDTRYDRERIARLAAQAKNKERRLQALANLKTSVVKAESFFGTMLDKAEEGLLGPPQPLSRSKAGQGVNKRYEKLTTDILDTDGTTTAVVATRKDNSSSASGADIVNPLFRNTTINTGSTVCNNAAASESTTTVVMPAVNTSMMMMMVDASGSRSSAVVADSHFSAMPSVDDGTNEIPPLPQQSSSSHKEDNKSLSALSRSDHLESNCDASIVDHIITHTGESENVKVTPIDELLKNIVDILHDHQKLPMNCFPHSVSGKTPMEHIYVLFEMVKANVVFVVSEGQLTGAINRRQLLKKLQDKSN